MKKKKSKLKIFAALATVTVVLTIILLMTTDKVEKELPPTQDTPSPIASNNSFPLTHLDRDLNSFEQQKTNLFWFVQVTDLHLSAKNGMERIRDLGNFCSWIHRVIRPRIVIASGDLTTGENQLEEDWKMYQETVSRCLEKAEVPSKWLDIRGNHDTYQVTSEESQKNFFKNFSIHGHLGSYFSKVEVENKTYGFVALDASLVPGPKQPFNYFGSLNSDKIENLSHLVSKAELETDHFFVFGHYPLSFINAPFSGLRHLLRNSKAYFCGHLHDLTGRLPNMYARHFEGFYELELADWAVNRKFRVVVMDNGLMSFVDTTFSSEQKQTVVIITNPIGVQFSDQTNFINTVKEASQIRVLVFSQLTIEKVVATLDDKFVLDCNLSKQDIRGSQNIPLYISNWNSTQFKDGELHSLQIDVYAEGQQHYKACQQFTLNSEKNQEKFSFLARLILMWDLSILPQVCFALSMLGIILPLCALRQCNPKKYLEKITKPKKLIHQPTYLVKRFVRCLWILATFRNTLYPVILGPIYLFIGPWTVGYFLDDSFGALFLWGLCVENTVHPATVASVYALIYIVPYTYIFLGLLALKIDLFCNASSNQKCVFLVNFFFLIFMILQCVHLVSIYKSLGFLETLSVYGLAKIVYFYFCWKQVNVSDIN